VAAPQKVVRTARIADILAAGRALASHLGPGRPLGTDGGARRRIVDDGTYRQIVEGSPDAIILGDREGKIRLWNAGAVAMFGFSSEEALGRSMDLIIPERLRARHWEGYDRTMATGVSRYGSGDLLAVPAITKDGRTLSIEFTIQMLRDAAGGVVGPVAIIRDVTRRFAREKEMARRLKELEAREAARRTAGEP
jgi:PAS domain S-box-containing protein